jgi:hypothetical protein
LKRVAGNSKIRRSWAARAIKSGPACAAVISRILHQRMLPERKSFDEDSSLDK